ncbi:virB8 family protein [Salmonella enterica]|uniref:virB8 family protein n=1 Tax=Salmonella enterica TaxID=28901 RepID=UPI003BBBBECE
MSLDNHKENQIKTAQDKLEKFLDENHDAKKVFEAIASWDDNELTQAKAGEKKAWRFAYYLGGLLGLAVIAIATMMPLKKVMPPQVIVLNESKGETFPLQSVKDVKIPLDSAWAKKSVNDFMLARENYTWDTAYLNYETAAAYMAPVLRTQWMDYWDNNNPQSPFKVYKKNTQVKIDINTIRLSVNKDGVDAVATVDYQRTVTKNGLQSKPERWIATITYERGDAPKAEREFRINPLGFTITNYQRDPFVASSVPASRGPTTALPQAPEQTGDVPAMTAPRIERKGGE